jgi:hypothetical protein
MKKRFRKSRGAKGRNSVPAPSLPMRLHPEQLHIAAKVKALRSDATDLRTHVSAGAYGETERERFYQLAQIAGVILHVSNPELAERAGLGDTFFSTLVRDRRYPKLESFLRALTAMIEVADELLYDIDRDPTAGGALPNLAKIGERIKQDHANLLLLALSLSQMALDEIEKLDAERPNDPDKIASYEKQRELLQLFANGFARIARALSALEADFGEPVLLGRAANVVESVGNGINKWWKKYEDEAIDWTVRIPVLTAGVAALGWAGANMLVGTTVVAALVGGKKVLKAIGKRATRSVRNKK